MDNLILTSYLDFYDYDNCGNKVVKNFGNKNGILDCIKTKLRKQDNFLFVSHGIENEDKKRYFDIACKSFDLTLPFKNYKILNQKTKNKSKELIENADLIFLCGGHLPTQNKFFNEINLKDLLLNSKSLIVGGSAGSMNCAEIVYCPPEVEGESEDINFQRYLKGLGLTDINILPHYDEFKNHILDGKRYIEDIILPDSYKTNIIALNNHSYITFENEEPVVYGESFVIKNGQVTKICDYNKCKRLKV